METGIPGTSGIEVDSVVVSLIRSRAVVVLEVSGMLVVEDVIEVGIEVCIDVE